MLCTNNKASSRWWWRCWPRRKESRSIVSEEWRQSLRVSQIIEQSETFSAGSNCVCLETTFDQPTFHIYSLQLLSGSPNQSIQEMLYKRIKSIQWHNLDIWGFKVSFHHFDSLALCHYFLMEDQSCINPHWSQPCSVPSCTPAEPLIHKQLLLFFSKLKCPVKT